MRLIPVGRSAVLVEVGSPQDAVSLATWSRERGLAGDVVPGAETVAEHWGCEVDEVAARHQATTFVSAFCGFAPGFAYLSGLTVPVPRLASPRTRVPAGAVALAGSWCGVYPRESPGGWQIIGQTDALLWDSGRTDPALLAPGTRVRFVAR